jgi:two-component system sensor histidine kinase UhpB
MMCSYANRVDLQLRFYACSYWWENRFLPRSQGNECYAKHAAALREVVKPDDLSKTQSHEAGDAAADDLKQAKAEPELATETFDRQISEGTRELAASNEELRKEVLKLKLIHAERDRELEGFRLQIERMPLAYVRLDAEHRVIDWNPAAVRVFGYSKEEALGQVCFKMLETSPADQIPQILRRIERGEMDVHSINYNRNKDGRTIICDWFNTPQMDSSGRFAGSISLAKDITERMLAAEEVRKSKEQLRALTARLQSIREEEAARISREIHDVLGEKLTGLKMDLLWMERKLSKLDESYQMNSLLDRVVGAAEITNEIMTTAHEIAADLRPPLLDKLGLSAALRFEAERFQVRHGIQCEVCSSETNPTIPMQQSTIIFRIFQECLTNVARHAGATRVESELTRNDNAIALRVWDNGKGIDESDIVKPESLGLLGMRERAELVGGQVHCQRDPRQGTIVKVHIPLISVTKEGVP